MKKEKKKTMQENYNAVHNLCEQYAGLNALRDIFDEAKRAEKIIATLDTEVGKRDEQLKNLKNAGNKMKDDIEAEYRKFVTDKNSNQASIDAAWSKHNKQMAIDREEKLSILEEEVKKAVAKSSNINDKLVSNVDKLNKLDERIRIREAQLKSIDDQINKLKAAIA